MPLNVASADCDVPEKEAKSQDSMLLDNDLPLSFEL